MQTHLLGRIRASNFAEELANSSMQGKYSIRVVFFPLKPLCTISSRGKVSAATSRFWGSEVECRWSLQCFSDSVAYFYTVRFKLLATGRCIQYGDVFSLRAWINSVDWKILQWCARFALFSLFSIFDVCLLCGSQRTAADAVLRQQTQQTPKINERSLHATFCAHSKVYLQYS